jgi:two-component system nitrogen regulation response regulator NtrX
LKICERDLIEVTGGWTTEPKRKLDILVVDDDYDLGESVADLLRLRGHTVRLVGDTEAAYAAVHDRVPDVLLGDYHLAETTAESPLCRLRSCFPQVARVLMSASSQEEWIALLQSGLVTKAIRKPVEIADLFEAVESVAG